MSDYSKITNFLSKDSLSLNDPAKYVKGSEIDAEYNAIAVAIATKADTASPTLTTPTMSSPTITGTITAAIANFSGLVTAALGLTVSGAAFNSRGITDNATAKALTLSGSGANSVTIANSASNPTIGTSGGDLSINPGGGAAIVAAAVASAVNYLYVQPGILTNENVVLRPTGSATNCNLVLSSKAAGSLGFYTNTVVDLQVLISHTASANRYITLTGSNGGNPTIGTSGGGLRIAPATGFADISGTGNAGLTISAAAASVALVSLYVNSAETARIASSADGMTFATGASAVSQVVITHTASSNRYITLTGANAANPKIATSAGSLDIGSPVVFTGQTVGTTVGATGAASALPANPLGYITTAINGTACKIPYYTA